jgi:Protein of unknown function (DUF2723)
MRKTKSSSKKSRPESVDGNPWLPLSSAPMDAWARRAPYLAFLGLAALYILTLMPSVAGGDSGELTAAALTGGVPHPSGYPLFAILARLFARLPFGHSAAWRVNLLSAVSMAAAGGLVCAVVQTWTRATAAGLLAAALFGTNPVVWSNATAAEVFGLNAMFVALAIHLWSRVEQTLSRWDVFALLLASGLAMCNHHTFLFVGVPLVLRSLWVARRDLGVTGALLALGIGLAGLLPYLYLMSPAASTAAVSWEDGTGTLDGLIAHILRRSYGTFSMGRPTTDQVFVTEGTFFPTLWHMVAYAFPRLLWIGPVLALAGFYLGLKNREVRKASAVLLLVFAFYVLSFCGLSNLSTARPLYLSILGRFCIEADLLLAIAAGFGFAAILHNLGANRPEVRPQRRIILVGVVTVFAIGVANRASQASGRDNTVIRDFVTTAFASLPPNAIVITEGDEITNSAFYLHDVENLRADVIHLGRTYLAARWYTARQRRLHPDLVLPEGGYGNHGWNIKRLLDGNPKREVIVIGHLDDWDGSWQDGYRLVDYGLVHWMVRANKLPTFEAWLERDRRAMANYDVVPALRAPEESWENALGERVLGMQVGRAHQCLVYGEENGGDPGPAGIALGLLEDVVIKSGGDEKLGIEGWPGVRKLDMGPALWKDLGIVYEISARTDKKYHPRIAVAYERFVEKADPGDPDVQAARNYLQQVRLFQGRLRR